MKKKQIIILSIVIIIIIVFTSIILKNKKSDKENIVLPELNISQVFEIGDISKSKYDIEKVKEIEIFPGYLTGTEMYELKADISFENEQGKMYYIRESYSNLNIYQSKNKIDEYDNISMQVEGIIENFETQCKNYLGIGENEKGIEQLLGESQTQAEIPLGESIYNENRAYKKTYELGDKKYDINFYRSDKKIVCELVLFNNI